MISGFKKKHTTQTEILIENASRSELGGSEYALIIRLILYSANIDPMTAPTISLVRISLL
jgi:hypothetical protein